jgi:hypothetical protein
MRRMSYGTNDRHDGTSPHIAVTKIVISGRNESHPEDDRTQVGLAPIALAPPWWWQRWCRWCISGCIAVFAAAAAARSSRPEHAQRATPRPGPVTLLREN